MPLIKIILDSGRRPEANSVVGLQAHRLSCARISSLPFRDFPHIECAKASHYYLVIPKQGIFHAIKCGVENLFSVVIGIASLAGQEADKLRFIHLIRALVNFLANYASGH